MRNKANFPNAKMAVNLVKTRNYNNEQRTMNIQNKPNQTQSCPPFTRLRWAGGLVRHSLGEGGFKIVNSKSCVIITTGEFC